MLMFVTEHTNLGSFCGKILGTSDTDNFLIIARGNPSFTEGISWGTGISVHQCTSFTFFKYFDYG